MKQVFVIASSSISAIGEQEEYREIDDTKTNLVEVNIPAENKNALYFSLKDHKLNKTFDEIIAVLSKQISRVITLSNLTKEAISETVLFLGSTSLDISCVMPKESDSIWLSQTDKLSKTLAKNFGLHAIHYTVNTACTSSANALLYASQMIKHNKINHALVVGCEFYNKLSVSGFDSLDLFSTTKVKPFSNTRDGLILGEGVGAIILSNKSTNTTTFELLGGYSSCDDFSLTITDEEGKHIADVVEKALINAKITPADIDLIKIHGTASEKSDLAEYNAISRVFSDNQLSNAVNHQLKEVAKPEVIGFKSFLGHTLGACGALELAILDTVFKKEILPKCEYQLENPEMLIYPFVETAQGITSSKYVLLNHFGFGGNNAALILNNMKPFNKALQNEHHES